VSLTTLIWAVSLSLFFAGLAAVVLRRQLVAMLLGLELMVTGANIPLVYYAGAHGDPAGLAAVLLIIAVAAAEAVIGLTLIIRLAKEGSPAETGAVGELHG
jgi:NADH-quinone oxidoreductase subunit K